METFPRSPSPVKRIRALGAVLNKSEGSISTYYTGPARAWQLLAAALSFAVFGAGGLFFALCIAPVLTLACRPRRRRFIARRIIGGWFRLFVRMLRAFGLIDYDTAALRRLDAAGRIIIANHPTLIDVVFLIGFIPQADCVVKGDLLRNPFMRSAVRAAGYLSNQDSEAFLQAGAQRLRGGSSVLIFPEGTRSPPGSTGRFLRGFANLALAADAPILPVVIRCTPPGLVKGEALHRLPAQPLRYNFQVLAPLYPAGFDQGDARARVARKLGRHAQGLYASCLEA